MSQNRKGLTSSEDVGAHTASITDQIRDEGSYPNVASSSSCCSFFEVILLF